jgi:putative transposase
MARPLRIMYPGAFYHVTSRGNERKTVFKSRRDREQFLSYLKSATERYGAVIHVYCLMDNHYHLLMETPLGNIARIMQHINSAYTTYFNIKRGRAGHLFQGRYKALLVEADEYAMELSRYIHLNPVRAGIEKTPEAYEWSSYRYYGIEKKKPEWLTREFILGYFARKPVTAMKKYRAFVESMIGKKYKSPLLERSYAFILGSEEFIEEIKAGFLKDRKPERDLPDLQGVPKRLGLREIESAVDKVVGPDEKIGRQLKLYFSHRLSGMKLKEIGIWYGLSESGVTQASRRVRERMKTDRKLAGLIEKIEKSVKV